MRAYIVGERLNGGGGRDILGRGSRGLLGRLYLGGRGLDSSDHLLGLSFDDGSGLFGRQGAGRRVHGFEKDHCRMGK
jgi:hypothetical protein